MILLFVLSKFSAPQQIETAQVDLKARIERLEEELYEIRGETEILNRELAAKREQLSQEKKRLARLQGDLSDIEGRFAASKGDAEVQNIIEGQLARALQQLTEEQKRLQQLQPRRRADGQVGGIPVDSEYVVFVIDTSNSMQRGAWPLVQKKLQEALAVYPQVKGLQVMNDDGIYMFPSTRANGSRIPPAGGGSFSPRSAPGSPSATAARWRALSRPSAPSTPRAERSACMCSGTSSAERPSSPCWMKWTASTVPPPTASAGCESTQWGFRR
jgi:hypothetical protein